METVFALIPLLLFAFGYPIVTGLHLNPVMKKRAIRIFIIGWAILLLCLTIIPSIEVRSLPVLIFIVPGLILAAFILIAKTKVCPICGHAVPYIHPYVEPEDCPECDSEYDPNDLWL